MSVRTVEKILKEKAGLMLRVILIVVSLELSSFVPKNIGQHS